MSEPDWRYFNTAEKEILEEIKDPKNQGRFVQWILNIALKAARAGKADVVDLRSRWK